MVWGDWKIGREEPVIERVGVETRVEMGLHMHACGGMAASGVAMSIQLRWTAVGV